MAGGTILVSDKHERLKPCVRCGYSLLHIAGARNCPECGLAVRISLSGNKALEWTNPRWQRFIATALCVFVLGLLCKFLSGVAYWIRFAEVRDLLQMTPAGYRFLSMFISYTDDASRILCSLAVCLLTKGPFPYLDRERIVRRVVLGVGLLLLVISLIMAFVQTRQLTSLGEWFFVIRWHVKNGPWIPLLLGFLGVSFCHDFPRRGRSSLLKKLLQLPLWVVATGLVAWLFSVERIFWPITNIVWGILFPLSMLCVLVPSIRLLLTGAREATANWVTDPS